MKFSMLSTRCPHPDIFAEQRKRDSVSIHKRITKLTNDLKKAEPLSAAEEELKEVEAALVEAQKEKAARRTEANRAKRDQKEAESAAKDLERRCVFVAAFLLDLLPKCCSVGVF